MSRDGGGRSGGGRSGGGPPGPPNDEHWSEAVRRRVRSGGDTRPAPAGEGSAADPEPAREPEPPGDGRGNAVRERVERRLRESAAPPAPAASPPATAPAAPATAPPAGFGIPRPADAPPADPDPDIAEPTGADPPLPEEDADRDTERDGDRDGDRDWEDADWDEVARRGRRAEGDTVSGVLARLLATVGFVGRLPHAPGTFGALVGLAAALLTRGLPPLTGIALFLGAAALGTWAAHRYASASGRKDPQEVVVDEACGMWLAAFAASPPAMLLLGAFALFRALDIVKPPPIRQLERLPGGFGIMADDLAAGLVTRVLLFAFFGY